MSGENGEKMLAQAVTVKTAQIRSAFRALCSDNTKENGIFVLNKHFY